MQRLTLREAARRTSRSITTLRRYIRSGRLRAEKRFGRFGPEYYLSEKDLAEAGLEIDEAAPARDTRALVSGDAAHAHAAPPAVMSRAPASPAVPMALFQELQMKHEQLLVQYGMVRAAGMRALELRDKLERAEEQVRRLRTEQEREARAQSLHSETSDQRLRRANLELEARALEIAALREKVRGLEMLTRNAVTNETIEGQFSDVMDQRRKIERLRAHPAWRIGPPRPSGPDRSS